MLPSSIFERRNYYETRIQPLLASPLASKNSILLQEYHFTHYSIRINPMHIYTDDIRFFTVMPFDRYIGFVSKRHHLTSYTE